MVLNLNILGVKAIPGLYQNKISVVTKYLSGVAALAFNDQQWQLSFASNTGECNTYAHCFDDTEQGYSQIIEIINKEFAKYQFNAGKVFLLYSPPESTNLFPILYKNFPPVIVVHFKRLVLHSERLGKVYANKSEMLAAAAISGLTTDLLLVETTNVCSFRCLFCPQDQMTREKRRLPFETARKIVKEYAVNSVGSIAFHLMGEPTLNPYLPKLVKLVAGLGIDHTLTTNGSALTKEIAINLFKSGLKRVQLSVQTYGEEQFYAFKRPAPKYTYEIVLKNIQDFILAKWQYAPDAEVEIHVMDTSLYQPRGVSVVSDDNRAREVVEFWRNFLIKAAEKAGNSRILSMINQDDNVKLVRDSWVHLNFVFEPTISLKFKMAGHWTQEFLENDEVIITASQGTCQQIANGGNNQLAIQANGDAVLCCFDFDGGTKIGNINDCCLRELDKRADKFRKRLVGSENLPFNICRRCLGIRVKVFVMGGDACSGKRREMTFNNIALYWLGLSTVPILDRFRRAGIKHLVCLCGQSQNRELPDYCQHYEIYNLPDAIEAIIFPAEWQIDTELLQQISRRYPDKFVGQIDLVALNPFARKEIIACKKYLKKEDKRFKAYFRQPLSFFANCAQVFKAMKKLYN